MILIFYPEEAKYRRRAGQTVYCSLLICVYLRRVRLVSIESVRQSFGKSTLNKLLIVPYLSRGTNWQNGVIADRPFPRELLFVNFLFVIHLMYVC